MLTQASTAGCIGAGFAGESDPEADTLLPGAKAGPWVIERELGRGGMGSVYAVVHDSIGKRAALKVMHRRLGALASAERILLEARVVNQVGHPNIVDIFETGALADGRAYIVMERLDGVPLSARADASKILPDQVIAILLQICDALIAAHAAGIIHRDLKLDNVFLLDNPDAPETPRVKLLDWGIAKVISNSPRQTIEGQLVGTPQYLAPEQARGAAVSTATDVYSLGVMAYEMFVEELPFQAETSAEIMAMHLRVPPPPPSELWPDIPRPLEALILAMLAKTPELRPSVLEVAHTLEKVRAELAARRETVASVTIVPRGYLSVPLAVDAEQTPSRHLRRWRLVAGALALAVCAPVYVLTRYRDSDAATTTDSSAPAVARHQPAVHLPAVAPAQVVVTTLPDPAPPAEVVASAPVAASELVAAAPLAAPHVARAHASHSSHGSGTHKHPAKPRRNVSLDPDGTIEPY